MVTIDVKLALLCLLFIALIVFVIYLAILAKNLVKTIKQTNQILEDAAVVTSVAAEKVTQVDGMVDDVQEVVSELSQAIRGEQNLVGAFTNLIKALGSLAAIFRKETEEEPKSKKKSKKK